MNPKKMPGQRLTVWETLAGSCRNRSFALALPLLEIGILSGLARTKRLGGGETVVFGCS